MPTLRTGSLAVALAALTTLGACSTAPGGASLPVSFLGVAIAPQYAERTIVITPQMKWVNVIGGESIRFVVGDKEFGWNFDGPADSFDLKRVAPPGVLDRTITAYVAPNPLYRRERR